MILLVLASCILFRKSLIVYVNPTDLVTPAIDEPVCLGCDVARKHSITQ